MPAVHHPPRHTALAALPAVVLDLETTGLDVANDRIVQIGAVAMRGSIILDEPRIDTLVDSGIPIPAASARVHRITDSDVAGSPLLPELLRQLGEALAGRVVVGQNVLRSPDDAGAGPKTRIRILRAVFSDVEARCIKDGHVLSLPLAVGGRAGAGVWCRRGEARRVRLPGR